MTDNNKVHTILPNEAEMEMSATGLSKIGGENTQLDNLVECVKIKTSTFDPTAAGEEAKDFEGEEGGFCHVAFKYADGCDKCMFFVATIASMMFGLSLPAFCIIFGDMLDSVGQGTGMFDVLGEQAIYMLIMGVWAFVAAGNLIVWYSFFAANVS
jgi:hypothetical protein